MSDPPKKRAEPKKPDISTGGGTYIEGDVNLSDGDFISRDQINLIVAIPNANQGFDLEASRKLLEAIPLDYVPEVGPLPAGSRILFSPNPLFVGRRNSLKILAKTFKENQTIAIYQAAVASGMGGIGKTQLASEFAHRYGRFFLGGVYWLDFSEPDGVPAEVVSCGRNLMITQSSNFNNLSLEEQVHLVQLEWQKEVARLLIFDSCDEPDLFARWRPPTGGCRILVTTRNSIWNATLGIESLRLDVLDRSDSVNLLKSYIKIPNDTSIEIYNNIASDLGDLPLALHLAGSYLQKYVHDVSAQEYLTQLE